MTTPMPPTDPSNADELLPGEAELSALYQQLPRSEPSAALDAAVLQAAAQAFTTPAGKPFVERRKAAREPGDWVHPPTHADATTRSIPSIEAAARASRRRAPRWVVSLASAASLVLVAGLAWNMRQTTPEAASPVAQLETINAGSTAATSASPEAAAAPAAHLASPVADSTTSMRDDSAIPPPAAAAARPREPLSNTNLPPMAAPMTSRAVSSPPAPPMRSAVPPPPPVPVATMSYEPAAAAEISQAADGSSRPTSSQKSMPSPMMAPAKRHPLDTSLQADDTPTQELDKIQQLFAQQRNDEALQRLEAFRKAHPQWQLPPALQAHLQDP